MTEDLDADLESVLGDLEESDLYGAQPIRGQRDLEGAQITGRVVAVTDEHVLVDIHSKCEGAVPLKQFLDGPPEVGSAVEVVVRRVLADDSVWLTLPGAPVDGDWETFEKGMIVEAFVTKTNKGGLEVEVNGLRGFMPSSQVDIYRVEDLEFLVGQKLRCEITEVSPRQRNLVVGRRDLLIQEREEKRQQTLAELEEGQVRTGTVRNVMPYGAFVDLGGVDGLVHIGDMSWHRVKSAEEVLQPGDEVQVKVLRIDPETQKIALGLKQLQPGPWDRVNLNYPSGITVTGRVTRLANFGVFVELEPGLEGLVHVSQISSHHVRRISEVVQEGDEVKVVVLSADPDNRKMQLSMKAALDQYEDETDDEDDTATPRAPEKPKPTALAELLAEKFGHLKAESSDEVNGES